ncbi:MAG: BMP family ABC transporter substrate-binding protein [Tissierellaceae bacterium]|nr:BMP family ABC transporter substrate-binding protein [Tissierellaceae bacterium]
MKKLLILTLALVLVAASLAGCGQSDTPSKGHEIALITDKGNIDDKSFNQGSWEGVVAFATENNITHTYIKPEDVSDTAYLEAIDLAVEGGAKVIVTPGFLFEVAVYEAQTRYPDVKFILLDGAPHAADSFDPDIKDNVASVVYAEEESGYLAGYAAVMDGMKNLGYMGGMAVPAVQAFGYGFLQGAEDAASELGMSNGDIKVIYHYTGNFEENDTNKATASTMYQEGMEVIFAAGGSVGKSVMAAAAEADKKVIGVDVDQRYDSETVMSSAMKGLAASVTQVLDSIYNTDNWGNFGGKTITFNAQNDGVGLPTVVIGDENADAFDRFNSFNLDDYEELYVKLKGGAISVIRTIDIEDPSGVATAQELTSQLNLNKVSVVTR